MIQGLIPLGLKAVEDRLQREVELLAGKKQAHGKENVRWGKQAGAVYLRDQKVPIMHPRVRKKITDTEKPLSAYAQIQEPYQGDRQTMLRLLQGISTKKYSKSMELVPEVFPFLKMLQQYFVKIYFFVLTFQKPSYCNTLSLEALCVFQCVDYL